MCVMVLALGLIALIVGVVYPSRRIFAALALVWAKAILFFSGVRLTVEGGDFLSDGRPRFFMGNHQSALDIPILVAALLGDVRFMAKRSLFRIPVFGWVLHRYGFAAIDRENARTTLRTLDLMLDRLRRRPINFAVFPEGTRSADGRLLRFRRGTMKIGLRSGLPIVPFSIDGSVAVHDRNHFEARPGPVRLTFGSPIPVDEVAELSPDELHRRIVATVASQLGQAADDAIIHTECVASEGA